MKNLLSYGTRPLAVAIASVLICQLVERPVYGQSIPNSLNIVVVQGEGSINHVRQRASTDLVIRVEDENQKPLSDAAVVFTLPTEGATGVFGNGEKTVTVMTDAQGSATAAGLRLNQVPGKVQIHINASYKGLTARTIVTQFTDAPAGYTVSSGGGGAGKWVAILAAVAAAGAGGAYYATRKSGNDSTNGPGGPTAIPSIGITPGAGVISPPPSR